MKISDIIAITGLFILVSVLFYFAIKEIKMEKEIKTEYYIEIEMKKEFNNNQCRYIGKIHGFEVFKGRNYRPITFIDDCNMFDEKEILIINRE